MSHLRCYSHNKRYKHEEVHPVLSQIDINHNDDSILEIEIVFHVLSPLPGLEKASHNE